MFQWIIESDIARIDKQLRIETGKAARLELTAVRQMLEIRLTAAKRANGTLATTQPVVPTSRVVRR